MDKVLDLETSERKEFLDESGISAEVRREVESLIAFEDSEENFTDFSAMEIIAGALEDGDGRYKNAHIGQQIGAYKIVREIGFGGMGVVYLAYRVDGKFEQTVALKLLKRELNTEALKKRFGNERKILATLNHPNIAHLLDAGTTDEGVPFLAMEYVEGLPINIFCDKHDYGLEERLALFQKVCEAVDFAHRNLVVHRDLKPSNILITKDGTPKLLDFGIAKLITPEFEEEYEHTITKFGVMTPSYASPEQIKRESVTTATDIYSLGVILFELLTGHRPFEESENDLKEIYRKIIEENPSLPSVFALQKTKILKKKAADKAEAADETLKEEFTESPTLVRGDGSLDTQVYNSVITRPVNVRLSPHNLRGDLDNIVLKALKKEPERRYSSAANFSEDIKKYQNGLPVSARPETFSYIAGKFIKRNRWAVASAGLILVTLIGGVIATFWQSQIARAERDKAQKRFNEVRALANSFLFEITPEVEKLSGSTRAKELIVKRALKYLDSLVKEAGGDLELQKELALAYEKVGSVQGNPYEQNVGDIEGARKSYEKAEAIYERLIRAKPDDIEIQNSFAKILELLGDIHFYNEDTKRAENYYSRSQRLLEKVVASEPNNRDILKRLASIYNELGLVAFWDGKNKESLAFYDKSRGIFERLLAENSEDLIIASETANTYVRIGEVLGWEERSKEAGEILQKGLEMLKEISVKSPNDKSVRRKLMLAFMRRAENFMDRKQFEKGIEFHRRAEEIALQASREDTANARAQRDLVIISYKVAEALDMSGKSREGLGKLEEVLSLQTALAERDSKNAQHKFDIANTLNAIGEARFNLKNFDAALRSFEQSIENYKQSGENPLESYKLQRGIAVVEQNIGEVYTALADEKKNRSLHRKALEYYKRSLKTYLKLKKQNNWSDFDNELIDKAEKQIKESEIKIK